MCVAKCDGPRFQTFCNDKLSYERYLTCKYLKMMHFYSETRKMKYLLDPPPSKRGQRYEWSRFGYTHMCLSIPAACHLDVVSDVSDIVIKLLLDTVIGLFYCYVVTMLFVRHVWNDF